VTHAFQATGVRLSNGSHDHAPLHPQDIAVGTLRAEILLFKVLRMHEMERRTHHVHTQHSGGASSYRMPPSKWCRASRLGARCSQRFVRGAVDERQFPENQQAPITFSGATTNVCRDQGKVFDSAGFGDEEGAHVENIDAVKPSEKLGALETSRLSDISGDVTSCSAGMVAAFHIAVTNGRRQKMRVVSGEVESVRTESVRMVRAHKGALAIVLLRACISVYVCCLVKVKKC